MKKILSWALMALLFLSVSCTPNEKFADVSRLNGPGVYGYLDPIVSDDGPGTKATVNPSDMKLSFELGDNINIWSSIGTLVIYSVQELTAGGGARFDGGGFRLDDGETYYSSYPLISSFKDKLHSLSTSYEGQVQTADGDPNHVAEYSYTYASSICTNGSASFAYHYLCRWLRFQLTLPEAMTVTELTVTADSEVFALDGKVDVTTGTFTPGKMSNTMTLALDNVSVTDGVLNAFMAHAPYTACSIVISVKDSEGNVYSSPVVAQADASTVGKYRTITQTLTAAPEEDGALEEGSYLILALDNFNVPYALKAEQPSGKHYLEALSYGGDMTFYGGDADLVWNVTKFGNSYIFENSGKNLGYNGSGDSADWLAPGADWASTNYLLDVAKQEMENRYNVTLHSTPARYLSYSTTSSNFAFFEGTDQAIVFTFVPAAVDSRIPVILTFNEQEYFLTNLDCGAFTGQTAISEPEVTGITYSAEGDPIGYVDASTGAVSLNGTAGRMIVNASFAGDAEYRPGFAQYAINVSSAPAGPQFSKVEEAPTDWAGEYLMVCEDQNVALSSVTTIGVPEEVEIIDNAVLADETTYAYKIVIANASTRSGYTIKLDGQYLSWTSGNSLSTQSTETDNSRWTITAGGSTGNWIVANVADPTREIWFNTGSPRFACYVGKTESTTGFAPIQLYVLQDDRLEAGMSWSAASASAELTDTGVSFTAPTLNLGNASSVTYNSTNPLVATINSEGNIEIVGGGETTIQAIFAGDVTYKPATAEFTLIVTDTRTLTISEIIASGVGSYEIENVVVMATKSGNKNFIVADETGAIVVYHSSATHGFEIGDVVSVSGSVTQYGGILEFNLPTVTKTGTTTPTYPTAVEFDADKITDYATNSTIEYGHAKGVVNGFNLTVADGKVLNLYGDTSDFEGRTIDVYGYSFGYNNDKVNFMLVGEAVIDETVPFISVSPGSYTWGSEELDFKQFAVTLNENLIGFTTEVLSGNSADWAYNGSSSILYIRPKAANTSTTEDKVIVLRLKHSGVYQDVTCTQFKVSDGTPTLQYTLDGTITSSGNAYATASNVTQNDIAWGVTANTEQSPWRVGGKDITNVDRPIYSKTAIPANISQIKVGSGSVANGLTVNSLTISVHNSAADAASGSNAIATKTFTTGIAGATVTFDKEDNTSWAGKFYRIVYNVTRTSTSQNGYITFYSAEFYGTN